MSSEDAPCTDDTPDYSVEIDAQDLREDIAEKAADRAEKHAYDQKLMRDDPWWDEPRYWALEEWGAMKAYAECLALLQPENALLAQDSLVNDDGTVQVREFMRVVSHWSDEAHENSYGPYTETRQADKAETAYARVLSLVRDDYGIGWPRIDDLGGVVEADLP